ncbi:hypothetical protein AKJ57_03885 [candidate division MSBL1 archaeon SCGC-AAA259A05]|uniref:L-fucose isomerase C-terminal domain-containing protein n=1 Tax=candidate division MSBL1 archaeon SCGC-AAA259A05 TaxID=1698259 RepID=A0A133U976_9EURY|nr:hypothetical protein AKJ57_03885 [candidate division MSBL1 archaeon SCGC-AAA259A05]
MGEKSAVLGLIVGNREFFPDELAVEGGKEVLEKLEDQGYEVVTRFSRETGEGIVDSREDSKDYSELFREKERELDGILVTLPNFGDEKSIAEIFKLGDLDVPVLVHAFADEVEKMEREHRRDSFCGKISVCNNLNQYGVPFTSTQKHVEDPDSEEFEEDLASFGRIGRAVNGLREARLGVVGVRPNAFQTVRYSEKILEGEGISVEKMGLMEIVNLARDIDEDEPQVQDELDKIEKYFSVQEEMSEEDVVRTGKLTAVLSQWIEENELDAISLQCWPAIEEYYGITPCGAMSLLTETTSPSACEVDVTGSLAMYALQLSSERPPAIVDLNNNYGKDPNKFVAFHCSNFPPSFFVDGKCNLGFHEMQGVYGSCEGRIASGPATFLRISTDDQQGKIRSYIAEGKFTEDELETFGGYGVVEIEGLQSLMDYIVKEGFEHHAAVVNDRVGDILEEALENYLGWEVHRHQPSAQE